MRDPLFDHLTSTTGSLRCVVRLSVLGLVFVASAAFAQSKLWIWFDDDGTPNISDRRGSPDAEEYIIGTFDEVALRQQNTPHRGLGGGQAGEGEGEGVAPAPAVPADVLALVTEMSKKHKVPRALLLAVVGVESGFRKNVVSSAGARGLMQLMPATAEDLGVNPDDPRENVDGGAKYLAWLLKHFKSEELALAGYNAGPGRVKRAGNKVPAIKETVAYVARVRAVRDSLVAAGM